MKKLRLFILIAAILPAGKTLSQSPDRDLKTFVTSDHTHGLPYEKAMSYGSENTPELIAMFKDSKYEFSRNNIALMLGIIGDSRAFPELKTYLHEQRGEISAVSFNTLFSVFQAMGHLARKGNHDALVLLEHWSEPKNRELLALQLSYKNFNNPAMNILLNRLAIQGLAMSGKDEAFTYLEKLSHSDNLNYREYLKSDLKNAMELNRKIKTEGST
ncbi:MAG: hypothetical protein ABUT20_53085, partial [Bacteroidota bacterium]